MKHVLSDTDRAWLLEFFSHSGPGRTLLPLAKGKRLFLKGTKASHVYMVRDGYISLSDDGKPPEILGPNRWSFEHAHELAHVHLRSAVSLTDSTVVQIEQDDFGDLLEQHPALRIKFLQDTADRVNDQNMSQEPVERRLARRLQQMSGGKDKIIEAGPTQLGLLIGASRQRVDKILRDFADKGLVSKLRRDAYHVHMAELDRFLEQPDETET